MKKSSIILLIIISISIAMVITIYADSSTYSTFSEAKSKGTELYVSGILNKKKTYIMSQLRMPITFHFI